MKKIHNRLQQFKIASSGTVAVTFAVALTSLLLASGLAVDYSRTLNVQSSLQHDLDAAMLGAAKKSSEIPEIKAAAKLYLENNWRNKFGIEAPLNVVIQKPEENLLLGQISVKVPTTLMSIAGISEVDVNVETEIQLAAENMEIALVLDVTESMIGTKIDALKSSATGLIDKVFENEQSRDHVRIALVPFADYVNVGEINRNANWIDVPLDTETTSESCIDDFRQVTGTSNCRMETFTYDRDGVPFTY